MRQPINGDFLTCASLLRLYKIFRLAGRVQVAPRIFFGYQSRGPICWCTTEHQLCVTQPKNDGYVVAHSASGVKAKMDNMQWCAALGMKCSIRKLLLCKIAVSTRVILACTRKSCSSSSPSTCSAASLVSRTATHLLRSRPT